MKLGSMHKHAKAPAAEATLNAKRHDLETELLAFTTPPKRFKEASYGKWAPVVHRPLRYSAYRDSYYASSLTGSNTQRCRIVFSHVPIIAPILTLASFGNNYVMNSSHCSMRLRRATLTLEHLKRSNTSGPLNYLKPCSS